MKKLAILFVAAAFSLGTIGCGAAPKAKSDSTASKAPAKPVKKSLKKMKGNRMEMSEEDE